MQGLLGGARRRGEARLRHRLRAGPDHRQPDAVSQQQLYKLAFY